MNALIENVYETLSKSEKIIADYFLHEPKEIITMNIHELSEQTGVSTATISRFVKKVLGKSFVDVKIELAMNYEEQSVEKSHEIFNWANDFDDMPSKISQNINSMCEDVLKYNHIDIFKDVVAEITKAENIYIFGVGNSGIVAMDLRQKLIKLGKRTQYITDSNFGALNSALCTKKDLIFSISNSGRTPEVNIASEHAKQSGAKVVSITGNTKNKLRIISDYCFVVPSLEKNESRLSAIFSRYGQLYVVDILFVGLAKALSKSPEDITDNYKDLLRKVKET